MLNSLKELTAVIPTLGRFNEVRDLSKILHMYGISVVVVFDGLDHELDGAYVSELSKYAKLVILSENVGQAEATDRGLDAVSTDKVMLIDSDDTLEIDNLVAFSHLVSNLQSGNFIFPKIISIGKGRVKYRNNINRPLASLRKNYVGAQSGVVFLKEDYLKLGGQSKKLRSCKDWDFWIKAKKNKYNFSAYDGIIYYSVSEDGISRNLEKVVTGRRQLWDSHPEVFSATFRFYDWYLLLRYLTFNCRPGMYVGCGLFYRCYFPFHYFLYRSYRCVRKF